MGTHNAQFGLRYPAQHRWPHPAKQPLSAKNVRPIGKICGQQHAGPVGLSVGSGRVRRDWHRMRDGGYGAIAERRQRLGVSRGRGNHRVGRTDDPALNAIQQRRLPP